MSFTLREIMDQYKALDKTIHQMRAEYERIRRFFEETRPRCILFTGCGSSYSLSCSMRSIASARLDIPVYALAAGDLWLNCEAYKSMFEGALVVSLSRSGRTSELINAVSAGEICGGRRKVSFDPLRRGDAHRGAVGPERLPSLGV